MAGSNAVWGIEIGQCALKAIKVRAAEEGKVEVLGFDIIEHEKILSQPEADPEELIKAALEKFAGRNEWQKDQFVIGVPGQQTFSRFVKLPPVDAKKIPDMVRFEASQQIPFDMKDVVWDYQVFQTKDSPDVEVGIFAMRRDLIKTHLDRFEALGITPIAIQTLPSALYNFAYFDKQGEFGDGKATVIVDVGAINTDLIIVDANSAWMRNIPLGGNSFTESLVKNFKLSFAKAESLKRDAGASKHARQIFQAMRPVFADLVAEIQRSLGFYASTHREVELRTVLASGNAFRLPGLQKYLENNLTIGGGVIELRQFNSVLPVGPAATPQFTDNVLSFGPAFGLAVQGLGMAKISSNLLPPELARVAMWNRKRGYFIAAAACLGMAALFPKLRNVMDNSALASGASDGQAAKQIVDTAKRYATEYSSAEGKVKQQEEKIKKLFDLQDRRSLVPGVVALVHEALPEIDPALANAKTADDLKKLIESNPQRFDRTKRKQILLDKVNVTYIGNIDEYARSGGRSEASLQYAPRPGAGGRSRGGGEGSGDESGGGAAVPASDNSKPGFLVSVSGYILYGSQQSEAAALLESEYLPRLLQFGSRPGMGFFVPKTDEKMNTPSKNNLEVPTPTKRFSGPTSVAPIVGRGIAQGQPGEPAKMHVEVADPVTGEEAKDDFAFSLTFKVKIGEPPKEEPKDGKPKKP